MLNSGKKICALRDKKNKYSNSCVVRKKFMNETKNHNPPFKLNGWSLSKQSYVKDLKQFISGLTFARGSNQPFISNAIVFLPSSRADKFRLFLF